MVELLRHRQTKEAATDMFCLQPPRHISTLPIASILACSQEVRFTPDSDRTVDTLGRPFRANQLHLHRSNQKLYSIKSLRCVLLVSFIGHRSSKNRCWHDE